MAQKGTLAVDTGELVKHARQVKTLAQGLDGAELALKQIDELDQWWQGDQHDTFVREYRGSIEMLTKEVAELRKFADHLLQAATIYNESMTTEVQDLVDALRKGQ